MIGVSKTFGGGSIPSSPALAICRKPYFTGLPAVFFYNKVQGSVNYVYVWYFVFTQRTQDYPDVKIWFMIIMKNPYISQNVIIRADILIPSVFHSEAARDYSELPEAKPLVQMTRMSVGFNYSVELQNAEAFFFGFYEAVEHERFSNMLPAAR